MRNENCFEWERFPFAIPRWILAILDVVMISVMLTVFLGSREAAEDGLFSKQTIHFRDLAKGEDGKLF